DFSDVREGGCQRSQRPSAVPLAENAGARGAGQWGDKVELHEVPRGPHGARGGPLRTLHPPGEPPPGHRGATLNLFARSTPAFRTAYCRQFVPPVKIVRVFERE